SYLKLEGGLSKGEGVLNRFEEIGQGPQLKPQRGGYVGASVARALPEYVKTKTSVETHNVVEDQSQRPTSDVGGVFSYQSINRETALRGELRLRQALVEELDHSKKDWRSSLTSEEYRIGRARKDDYGSVKIEFEPNTATVKQPESSAEEIRVWLLSDLLLRDERLRPTASIARFAQVLGGKLGVTLTLRETPKPDCKNGSPQKMNFAARPHRTDSWNTAWVLPRPSLVGLSAGSCFVFEIKKDAQFDATGFNNRLREVAANGLGERRAEGYGQMCFDDQLLSASFAGIETSRDKSSEKKEAPRVASTPYAHLIETEGWRKEIRRRALSKASSIEGRKEALGIRLARDQSKPRMSQLGALRSVLTQLRDCQDAGKIKDWIANLKESKNRSDEWPPGSLDLIEKLVTEQSRVWELLKEDQVSFAEFTITQDGEMALANELWAETVRTLVDACVRAQKRDLEKLQQQAGSKPGKKGA
ncbi:MAG: RAMP superfamily CRISPR-associated protein, partial [Blastocatellia bacterium]